jgi:hypothetical protein
VAGTLLRIVSNPLADDSDDEKRINRAGNKALKEKKERQKGKNPRMAFLMMLGALLHSLFPGSLFVDQRPFNLDSPVRRSRDFPSAVSIVGSPTTKEKSIQNSISATNKMID